MENFSYSTKDKSQILQDWSKRVVRIVEIRHYTMLVYVALLLLCSSVTFILVICKRKTRDIFALVLLIGFIVSSASFSIDSALDLFTEEDYDGQKYSALDAFG